MLCDESADGHAKTIWRGRLFCSVSEGGQDPIIVNVPFAEKTVHRSIRCERNQDVCTGGAVFPAGEASMDVRNLNEDYDGNGATTVEQGQDFVYKATFRNDGSSDSVAKNATLTVPIPPNTTFVACPETCDGQPSGGSVTWNLGDVPGETEVSKQLQLKVNPDAPVGDIINVTTGAHDGKNAGDPRVTFDSNTTTVTVTAAPVDPRDVPIDVQESTINASSPKKGVVNVVINDPTADPQTMCFGRTGYPPCVNGTSLGVANYDSDPELELKMKFPIKGSGLQQGDRQACVAGETFSDEPIEGCDSVTVN